MLTTKTLGVAIPQSIPSRPKSWSNEGLRDCQLLALRVISLQAAIRSLSEGSGHRLMGGPARSVENDPMQTSDVQCNRLFVEWPAYNRREIFYPPIFPVWQ